MFITVRYGADEHCLLNPDCTLSLLVDFIRRKCGFPSHACVALVNDDLHIIELADNSLETSSHLFVDRGIYILLAIEKGEQRPLKYVALLEDADSELTAKLETLSNPKAFDQKALSRSSMSRSKRLPKTSQPATASKSKRNTSISKPTTRNK